MKVRNIYKVLLVLSIFSFLNLGEEYVRAGKEEPSPDVSFTVSKLPDCSYGYGQCRKSCLDKQPATSEESLYMAQESCLKSCHFLYNECR